MRLIYFAIFCFICLNFSCSKSNTAPVSLVGDWELRVGYLGQGGQVNYPAGNGNRLHFDVTTYKSYVNDTLQFSGTYKIVKADSYLTGKTENRIIYNDENNSTPTFATVSNDSLSFWLDANDAGGSLYIKQ